MNTHFVTVQTIRIRVNEHGSGQPVLFIHGNPDSAEMWDGIIERLPAGYHCIAPDLPGFGRSESAASFDWSIANRGQWVADLLDRLGVTAPVTLVAHDHGGPFAASFAVQFPQRVQKIVLQNTLFNADYSWHLFGKIWRTPLLGEISVALAAFPPVFRLTKWYMQKGSPLLTDAYIRELAKTWTPNMVQAMLAVYRASSPRDFAGWQEKLNALIGQKPTLVLWGEHDFYLPFRFAEQWQKAGAKLIRYPDAGHWLAVEKPTEYAQALTEFFEAAP